jgi:hypothetical protein
MRIHRPVLLLTLAVLGCQDTAEAPVFSPGPGTYAPPIDVTLSTATQGATMRYAFEPNPVSDTQGTVYTDPIRVTGSVEIVAVAYGADLGVSDVAEAAYEMSVPVLTVDAPILDPGPGTYTDSVAVTMYTATPSADIVYTLDGTSPSGGSALPYSTPVLLEALGTTQIRAIATAEGMEPSIGSGGDYTIVAGQVETPWFTPEPGELVGFETVVISTATLGAELVFSTDGSIPSCTVGTPFTDPIALQSGDTLCAIACLDDTLPSEVVCGDYTFGLWHAAVGQGQILQSTNRGTTWDVVQSGAAFTDLASDGNQAWVAVTSNGMSTHSHDRGLSWQSSPIGLLMVNAVATDMYGTWIAGGADDSHPRLRDSVDQGATWDVPSAPVVGAIEDIATDGVTWLAVTGEGEVLRSTDVGQNWVVVFDNTARFGDVATDGTGTWVACGMRTSVAPFTTDSTIMVSSDDGLTWQEAIYDSVPAGAMSLASDRAGTFLIGGDDTLLRSTDGITWGQLSPIQPGLRTDHLGTDRAGRWLAVVWDAVALTGGELYASDDAGNTWAPVAGWPVGSRGEPVFGF